jgi:mannosyltransferase
MLPLPAPAATHPVPTEAGVDGIEKAPPLSGTGWRRRLTRIAPSAGPGVLMLLVALIGAGRPVLSWDEIATADAAARTPGQIWHLILHIDGVFGGYYFLIHFWTGIAGSSELALRFPSIVAMAGAAALTGELGRRLFGPFTGAVAGVLLCLMPNASRYAAEARPYAFACFFSLLALLTLHAVVERPTRGRWVAYAGTVLLLGLAHVVALTTLAAHLVPLIRRRSRRLLVTWGVTVGAVLVALGPVFWLGTHERDAQLSWIPPLTLNALWKFPGLVVGSVPGGWLLVGLALFVLWRPIRQVTELTVLALAPMAVVAAVSVLVAPYWVVRYLLIVLAPLALLAATGLTQPANARGRVTAEPYLRVLTVLVLLSLAVYPGERSVRGADAKNGSDYRGAAALVTAGQRPGDGIVFTPHSRTMRTGLDYYLRRDPGRPADVLLARSAADVASLRAQEFPDAASRARGRARIWLFVYGTHPDPATVRPDLRPLLTAEYRRTGIWYLHRATLALFVRRP